MLAAMSAWPLAAEVGQLLMEWGPARHRQAATGQGLPSARAWSVKRHLD